MEMATIGVATTTSTIIGQTRSWLVGFLLTAKGIGGAFTSPCVHCNFKGLQQLDNSSKGITTAIARNLIF
jgi:hypothetical protein